MTREEARAKVLIATAAIKDVAENYEDEVRTRFPEITAPTPIELGLKNVYSDLITLNQFLEAKDFKEYLGIGMNMIMDAITGEENHENDN